MARALFFGRLRDAAGCSERQVAIDRIVDINVFRRLAADGDAQLEAALATSSIRVAVNAVIASRVEGSRIAPDDEVAFMPPFSGG